MKTFIITTILSLIASNTYAYCKEISPGEFESTNSLRLPSARTHTTAWNNDYVVTNISNTNVTVRMQFTDVNGNEYTPQQVVYSYNFSSDNSPINLINGAQLQPGETGRLNIDDPSTLDLGIGKITWSSNECIYEALMVRHINQFSASGRYSSGIVDLNGGHAF